MRNHKFYRKIYEQYFGPIPVDENGRTYDIHHLDGNRDNNNPSNLVALSVKDHYYIHYSQEDWGACHAIMIRMNFSSEEISEMASRAANKRIEDGTHNFLTNEHRVFTKKRQEKRIENGTHQWADDKNPVYNQLKTNSHPFQKRADGSSVTADKVKNGTHPFLGGEIQRAAAKLAIENGTSSLLSINSYMWTCHLCGKVGKHKANESRHLVKCQREFNQIFQK